MVVLSLWQVAIDSIDADLFGRGVRGGFFQPSDAMLHRIRTTMYDILREAYAEDMVRSLPLTATQTQQICRHASRHFAPWLQSAHDIMHRTCR